jgi:hypothetical protein
MAGFTEAAASSNEDAYFVDLAMTDADLKRKIPPAKNMGEKCK